MLVPAILPVQHHPKPVHPTADPAPCVWLVVHGIMVPMPLLWQQVEIEECRPVLHCLHRLLGRIRNWLHLRLEGEYTISHHELTVLGWD